MTPQTQHNRIDFISQHLPPRPNARDVSPSNTQSKHPREHLSSLSTSTHLQWGALTFLGPILFPWTPSLSLSCLLAAFVHCGQGNLFSTDLIISHSCLAVQLLSIILRNKEQTPAQHCHHSRLDPHTCFVATLGSHWSRDLTLSILSVNSLRFRSLRPRCS